MPPKELWCSFCKGVGQRNNEDCDECWPCLGTGVGYDRLLDWLKDPANNPDDAYYSVWNHYIGQWVSVPISKLVETWILQKRPPLFSF